MVITRISVEPSVLRWARETAGLDVATAAERIGVKLDRVEQWEAGSLAPTLNQIRTMSDAYVRPLAALFMIERVMGGDNQKRGLHSRLFWPAAAERLLTCRANTLN